MSKRLTRLRPWLQGAANERGQLFPMVLGVLVIVGIISVIFATYIAARQQLAGLHYRAMAARYLAEAGMERAIWVLQNSPGRQSRLPGLSEALSSGTLRGDFTVESVEDDGAGLATIVTTGSVRGSRRGVRATVKLSPHVLRYALFGDRLLRFEGSASRTYVVPGSSLSACASEARVGSNGEIWLATDDAAINYFAGATLRFRDGQHQDRTLLEGEAASGSEAGGRVGQLVLPERAMLTLGSTHRSIGPSVEIARRFLRLGAAVVDGVPREGMPAVERATLQALADTNTANAEINEAAGRQMGRPALRLKRNSLYSGEEFELVVAYLIQAPTQVLHGPVYVRRSAVIPGGASVRIQDGFLVTEGSLTVQTGGRLEIFHSPAVSLFPGVVAVGETAPIVVQQDAVLIVDGLVYAERIFDAGEGALIDIAGSLIGADPLLSFRNHEATVVIRYDPAVLGTIGIRPPAGAGTIVRIVAWIEVR